MLSIHDVTGVVTQILPGQKYVVAFAAFDRSQTGILTGQKLRIVGSYDTPDIDDFKHVIVGSKVRFSCHEFESKADHEHDWYVTSAWLMTHMNFKDICLGLYNCSGKVQYLTNRLGVLNFTDHNGSTHAVLFLASKFFLRGKRLNVKQNLPSLIAEDNHVLFDAVPCIPDENDFQCSWFATNVWFQGPRPLETKFETSPDEERCSSSILREYKMVNY